MFWSISRSLERYLREQVPQLVNPTRILEFGPGRSTKVLAAAFPKAYVDTLEHQEAFYLKHLANLQHLPLVTVYHCPLDKDGFYSSGVWQERTYDLVLVDGPPKHTKVRAREGAACIFGNLNPGALVILDDSHRPDEQEILRNWTGAHPVKILCEGGTFTVLQHTGSRPVTVPDDKAHPQAVSA